MFIYKIKNLINGKEYIGISINSPYKRWCQHVSASKQSIKHSDSALHSAIRKYGEFAFEVELLCVAVTDEQLNLLEQLFISKYNTRSPKGYNLTAGGEGLSGYVYSDEQRKHLSKIRKDNLSETAKLALAEGRKLPMSKEAINRLSIAHSGSGNPMYGVSLIPINKGKKHAATTKNKMKQAKAKNPVWNKGLKGVQIAWNKGLKKKV